MKAAAKISPTRMRVKTEAEVIPEWCLHLHTKGACRAEGTIPEHSVRGTHLLLQAHIPMLRYYFSLTEVCISGTMRWYTCWEGTHVQDCELARTEADLGSSLCRDSLAEDGSAVALSVEGASLTMSNLGANLTPLPWCRSFPDGGCGFGSPTGFRDAAGKTTLHHLLKSKCV